MDSDSINYGMEYDADAFEDSQESEQTTQTQSTQQASQPPAISVDSHLWGYLQPCSPALTRIDFWRIHPRYTIGRNTEINQVVLPGFKVSNQHCVITWDGKDQAKCNIIVQDLSSNGTFINGEKVGKGLTRILNDGNEIAFGTSAPQPQNGGLEDYRFVYRHTASGPPSSGLYASYDIGIELGKGSFASVKRAIHKQSGIWYAVKMINAAKTVRQNGASRSATFAREISIMEKLEHRNICKLVEVFFQEDSSINLVLELVEGGDLLEYILKSETGLDELHGKDITYQICDALAYIHSKGITHRDMKPENVLLTLDNPPLIKVADFGLAKVVDSLTMLKTMCGTPSYLAPEVIREPPDGYDNLVDSWSVGVIVFSMLTNQGPFIEDENSDVRTRILTRRVDWPSLTARPLSPEAIDFIRLLLEEHPRRRMSLTNALHHPWLREHIPFHGFSDAPDESNDAAMLPDEPVVKPATPEDIGNSNGLPTADIFGAGPGHRLQRRKVGEEGEKLPEPSWEMVAYANAIDSHSGRSS
ncbi:kinase-like domain-containing protein [Flammula alnicola]|nr:kinase-like domain-containing protein [Flammula alnicola]